jgi:hypothetical protein
VVGLAGDQGVDAVTDAVENVGRTGEDHVAEGTALTQQASSGLVHTDAELVSRAHYGRRSHGAESVTHLYI